MNKETAEMIKEFKESFAYCGVTLTEKTFSEFFTVTPTVAREVADEAGHE